MDSSLIKINDRKVQFTCPDFFLNGHPDLNQSFRSIARLMQIGLSEFIITGLHLILGL